jgi:hypothetical protein
MLAVAAVKSSCKQRANGTPSIGTGNHSECEFEQSAVGTTTAADAVDGLWAGWRAASL